MSKPLIGLTLLASTFLFTQNAFSQSRQRWSLGPRVGANLSTLTNLPGGSIPQGTVSTAGYLFGLSAGVGALYSDVSRFGLGIDLLYSQRGYEYTFTPNTNTITPAYTGVERVHYLELPVTARYFLTRSGSFRPNIFAGPVFSARLGAKSRTDLPNEQRAPERVDNLYRPAEVGITAGIQLNFRAGDSQRFTIDGRYTYGITDAQVYVNNTHNQFFTLGIGYNFGIGRQYQPGDPKLTVPR